MGDNLENERLRVLLGAKRRRAHPSSSMAIGVRFRPDAGAGAPDGTKLPPNRDVMQAVQNWNGQGCLVVNMAPQPLGRVFNASGKTIHGIRVEMKANP